MAILSVSLEKGDGLPSLEICMLIVLVVTALVPLKAICSPSPAGEKGGMNDDQVIMGIGSDSMTSGDNVPPQALKPGLSRAAEETKAPGASALAGIEDTGPAVHQGWPTGMRCQDFAEILGGDQ